MIVRPPRLRRLLLFLTHQQILQLRQDVLALILSAEPCGRPRRRARLPPLLLLTLLQLLLLLVSGGGELRRRVLLLVERSCWAGTGGRGGLGALGGGGDAVERGLLEVRVLDAELAVGGEEVGGGGWWGVGGERMVALGVVTLDHVLGGVVGLAWVVARGERGTGVSGSRQRYANARVEIQLRLAVVVKLIARLLGQLERQLRNTVSIRVVKDAHRLLSDRIAMLLVEPLRSHIRGRAVRGSV